MSVPPRIVVGHWDALRADAEGVRRAVFVAEQGFPEDEEWDEHDAVSVHAVAYVDDVPVGTGRLLPDARIGRMAVLAAHRGVRVGAAILDELVGLARARGEAEVTLSSQLHACGFYAGQGFEAYGPEFDDTGVAHRMMRRRLGD